MGRRPTDARQAAEAAFKAATTKPVEPLAKGPATPIAKGPAMPLGRAPAKPLGRASAAPAPPVAESPSLPGAKELVSLRIDRDVLDYFQEQGPGWQDKINAALRQAAGK
jgi:uncharacterized protein (DUF4415 family)